MINRTIPAKIEKSYFNQDAKLADKIPYAYLLDEETIETKSGHLIQVIRLEGLMAETLSDSEINFEKEMRNTLLKSISDSSTAIYFHMIRKKDLRRLSGTYEEFYSRSLNERWNNKL